ncbi:hypothetical protein OUZ56_011880 [Daphnia magna]|uniref:Uncharacterized protein n=1 Tax=Daphnia magna TaxID=35525 RepID=A0ABQ9Z1E8_9CRUS|nr:hypothetical protein OUZ56_011880 [Daphnia magna]
MGHLVENETKKHALIAAVGQMQLKQAQLRKIFNDQLDSPCPRLARELRFLQKVTWSLKKTNRVLDRMVDILHGWKTGLADAARGRLSSLLCPPNVMAQVLEVWLESVTAGQGEGGAGERQRSIVHSSVDLEFFFPLPIFNNKEESVSHSYTGLPPYLGVSPDRQLFVELNVDEAWK